MKLVISHRSALRIWRAIRQGKIPQPTPVPNSSEVKLDSTLSGATELRKLLAKHTDNDENSVYLRRLMVIARNHPLSGVGKIDVLVTRRKQRHKSKILRPHLISANPPSSALCILYEGIYMVMPEYLLLLLAEELSQLELLAVAYEFCGTYSVDPDLKHGFQMGLSQLTTINAIKDFAGTAIGKRNIKKIRGMIPLLHERSASPRETDLACALSYSPELGGYWMGDFQMNPREQFEGDEAFVAGGVERYPDILFCNRKVIVEYDSKDFHSEEGKASLDKDRADGLRANGYEVVTITSLHFEKFESFLRAMVRVGSYMGSDVMAAQRSKDVATTRKEMVSWFQQANHQPL